MTTKEKLELMIGIDQRNEQRVKEHTKRMTVTIEKQPNGCFIAYDLFGDWVMGAWEDDQLCKLLKADRYTIT